MQKLGVHSEVGKLRTVMVCRPGLAHQRLTPGNAEELLFDDVLWVQEAQKDHYDFVLKMRERGHSCSIAASRSTMWGSAFRICGRGSTRCPPRSSPSI